MTVSSSWNILVVEMTVEGETIGTRRISVVDGLPPESSGPGGSLPFPFPTYPPFKTALPNSLLSLAPLGVFPALHARVGRFQRADLARAKILRKEVA